MAKGLRASVKKNNRNKLRARVFGPVEDARTGRLSAKLLDLAQQPKPAKSEMEVDSEKELADEQQPPAQEAQQQVEDMDVDGANAKPSSASKKSKKSGRIQKKRHRKARNDIVFRKIGKGKKTRGGPGRS